MPIPKEYRDICEMLISASEECRVNWVEKAGRAFSVYLPEFIFDIWSGTDEDDETFVAIGIRNPNETSFIDSFHLVEGDKDFAILYELWKSVRRQTPKVSQKLEAFREILKAGQQVGTSTEEILIIVSARYGAKGHMLDVTDVLRSKIISGRIKNFQVTNENFGKDPIQGVPKTLEVNYEYGGKTRSLSISEGSTLTIPE